MLGKIQGHLGSFATTYRLNQQSNTHVGIVNIPDRQMMMTEEWLITYNLKHCLTRLPARTTQGGGGSLKERKPIGTVPGWDSKTAM